MNEDYINELKARIRELEDDNNHLKWVIEDLKQSVSYAENDLYEARGQIEDLTNLRFGR